MSEKIVSSFVQVFLTNIQKLQSRIGKHLLWLIQNFFQFGKMQYKIKKRFKAGVWVLWWTMNPIEARSAEARKVLNRAPKVTANGLELNKPVEGGKITSTI